MDNYFNFKISDQGSLSRQCLEFGVTNFMDVCNLVKELPYGRNSDRSDFASVIKEQKGTCSTKHAFLKQLTVENSIEYISLCLGIYKMNASNTKGIGSVLSKHRLIYIPEAHTYLKYKEQIFDFTSTNASNRFYDSILYEEDIEAKQIGSYKVNLHQQFLKSWIKENDILYSFKEVWNIREQCILALSQ
ncbi:hypothetical protein [uncultured Winogradskyella sp.]|uniref:hypothetical protein n=1 Tax=uncultured Winogradskyella sp. TaxID=395353 RepID=UPI00260277FA|nr:hypothetical protein [uncultured Winogradskyella sp.]